MNSKHDYAFKCVLIGEPGVGKTSMLKTYLKHARLLDASGGPMGYQDSLLDMGEVDTMIRFRNADVKLTIYDTMGMERFRSMSLSFFRRSHGCLLCFDVTNESSTKHLDTWYSDITMGCMQNCVVKLVGLAHAQLADDYQPKNSFHSPKSVARQFAQHHKLEYTEVYLADKMQVIQCFNRLVGSMISRNSGGHSSLSTDDSVSLGRASSGKDQQRGGESDNCSC